MVELPEEIKNVEILEQIKKLLTGLYPDSCSSHSLFKKRKEPCGACCKIENLITHLINGYEPAPNERVVIDSLKEEVNKLRRSLQSISSTATNAAQIN